MAGHIEFRALFRSPRLEICDVRCTCPAHADPGAEEAVEGTRLAFVRRGLFKRRVGRETYLADAGQVLAFQEGRAFRVSHPVAGGDDCTSFWVDDSTLRDLLSARDPRAAESARPGLPFVQAAAGPRAFLIHRQLLARLRDGATALEAESLAQDLLAEVLGAPAPPSPSAKHRELAMEAALILNRHLQDPPDLAQLAGILGCSPFHLSRLFARAMGRPLGSYLHGLRLRAALERLAQGETDLTALAMDLGYADHSHFTNAFRREFGLSPSAARKGLSPAARKIFQAPSGASA